MIFKTQWKKPGPEVKSNEENQNRVLGRKVIIRVKCCRDELNEDQKKALLWICWLGTYKRHLMKPFFFHCACGSQSCRNWDICEKEIEIKYKLQNVSLILFSLFLSFLILSFYLLHSYHHFLCSHNCSYPNNLLSKNGFIYTILILRATQEKRYYYSILEMNNWSWKKFNYMPRVT